MARNFGRDIRWKWCGAGFGVTHALVDGNQLRPHVDGEDVHDLASSRLRAAFHFANQRATDPLALAAGIDGKQSKVRALSAQFEIDGSEKLAGSLGEQKRSSLKHTGDLRRAGPIVVNHESFDLERQIHQCNDLRHIRFGG